MEPLLKINDLDIFPNKKPNRVDSWSDRKTVKIIVVNEDGNIALVTNSIHRCYLLPGGGIEHGENLAEAADRECREEIGFGIADIQEVGTIEEYRAREGRHYMTYGVVARADEVNESDDRTDNEKNLGMSVEWRSVSDALSVFAEQKEHIKRGEIAFYNTAFNIVRDSAFLDEALANGLVIV